MFQSVSSGNVDNPGVVVIGYFQGESPAAHAPKKAAWLNVVETAGKRGECSGESGKLAEAFPSGKGLPNRIIMLGLGKKDKFKTEAVRSAAAAAARRIAAVKETRVLLSLSAAVEAAKGDAEFAGRCAGEAFGLLAWDNTTFKGKGTEKKERQKVVLGSDSKKFAKGLSLGLAIGDAANLTRSLSETPPNIATPDFMANAARKLARECGLEITVFKGNDLVKHKLAGLINVGKASENKPCLIRLAYKGHGKGRKAKPAVLIGKTVTYDTGGLSLKVNNGMVGMKRDKDGGCAVLGAMKLVATTLKPSRPVVAYLCAAENSVSDNAYRPDDIVTYRNGVTVEVTNTDAEGRLVLADGFCYACDHDDPAYLVELSTLTGGVITALGSTFAGMFCDDDKLRTRVEKASATSGERVWRLPLHSEYRDMMKSPVADILNSNPNRKAHAGQGAAFLSYFVKEGVPWCHLDIAGMHVSEADSGMYVKGSSGWGVRILTDLLAGE